MRTFEQLSKLSRIIHLIRDPDFIATQTTIAIDLKVSDRTCRTYFDELTQLNAPLVNHGRCGWELGEEWDFWAALKEHCTKLEKN